MMRRFFLKRLKRYSLLLMTPSLLLLVALFIINSTTQLRSLKRDSSQAVDSIRRGFNAIYEDTCYQQNMMTVNPQLTLSLRKILMRGRSSYSDYVFLNSMKSILQSAASSHPSIHSIYLYIDGYENFLASSDGVRPLDNYFDAAWLAQYEGLPAGTDNVVVRRVIPASAYQREYSVLTIFQRMTYIRGVIVINIEQSVFSNSIAAYLPYPESALRICADDGSELLRIGAYPSGDAAGDPDPGAEPGFVRIVNRRFLRAFSHDDHLSLDYSLLLLHTGLVDHPPELPPDRRGHSTVRRGGKGHPDRRAAASDPDQRRIRPHHQQRHPQLHEHHLPGQAAGGAEVPEAGGGADGAAIADQPPLPDEHAANAGF